MASLYEKLFSSYGASVLQELDRDYDEEEIFARLGDIPLDKQVRLRLEDLFFEYHWRWSTDAFTVGLHLGLSLLHNDIRRCGPE